MQSVKSLDFDALKLSDVLQRDNVFTMTVYKMLTSLPKNVEASHSLNTDKLIHFLNAIGSGYRKNVSATYHNDLHGIDVAQSMFMFISQGMLDTVA